MRELGFRVSRSGAAGFGVRGFQVQWLESQTQDHNTCARKVEEEQTKEQEEEEQTERGGTGAEEGGQATDREAEVELSLRKRQGEEAKSFCRRDFASWHEVRWRLSDFVQPSANKSERCVLYGLLYQGLTQNMPSP